MSCSIAEMMGISMRGGAKVDPKLSGRVLRCLSAIAAAAIIHVLGVKSAPAATLTEIKARGYMVVATEDNLPPFEYVVATRPRGYDTDLLGLLKADSGIDIRQEIVPWQEILSGVESGKYDAAVTAAVITPRTSKRVDFTTPIAEATMAYIGRSSDKSINSIKDLAGRTVGVLQDGASAEVIPDLQAEIKRSHGKPAKVVEFRTYAEAYQALVSRRVDAVISNATTLAQLVRDTSGVFKLGQQVGKKSYAAWAVKKGNFSVLEFLDAFLAEQKSNGTLARLQAKYSMSFPDLPRQAMPGRNATR